MSHMPPVPPANRSNKGVRATTGAKSDTSKSGAASTRIASATARTPVAVGATSFTVSGPPIGSTTSRSRRQPMRPSVKSGTPAA